MSDVPKPLSYALPEQRTNRFRCVLAVLPFAVGMFVGWVASGLVFWSAHQPVDQDALLSIWWMAASFGIVVELVYATAVLVIWAAILRPAARRWPLSGLLGALLTLLAFGGAALAEEIGGTRLNLMGWITLTSLGGALILPFLLVRFSLKTSTCATFSLEQPKWAVGLFFAVVLMLTVAGGLTHRINENAAERGYVNIVTWIGSTHPPVAGPNLKLPTALASNSANGTVDAVALPDGRIVILVKKMIGWKNNWSGVIYCTGLVRPAEIGRDAYGRPMLLFKGLSDHFIIKQIDNQHFEASFDLG